LMMSSRLMSTEEANEAKVGDVRGAARGGTELANKRMVEQAKERWRAEMSRAKVIRWWVGDGAWTEGMRGHARRAMMVPWRRWRLEGAEARGVWDEGGVEVG